MKKPYKIYSETIDPKAVHQFFSALEQIFVVSGALMPDAHAGYTLPIGGVVKTKDIIVPAWVGYDINCGVCSIKTNISLEELNNKNKQQILQDILDVIPVGFNHRKHSLSWRPKSPWTKQLEKIFYDRGGFKQLGSLGSGNHAIEVAYDENNSIYIMIHSGSRGVGHDIADHYMKLAANGNHPEWHYGFNIDSQNGQDYYKDLKFMEEFALENRVRMIKEIENVFNKHFKHSEFFWDSLINRTHNHAELKDGHIIHRKGATHAEKGMMGVIPGNMRDGSFIVEGLGNEEALCSSSHGAGRVLSRGQAKRTLNYEEFKNQMKNVVINSGEENLDEAPDAYKNIFEVMELQKDLVKVVAHIKPIINIKG